MQVQVPAGNTQDLLKDIDQAPNGATLHLSGTYNVSDTVDAVGWKAGVLINKDLTLSGGTLQSDGSDNVISVHKGAMLTLDGGINVTGGKAGHGAGVYTEGGLIINNAQIHDNHGWDPDKSEGAGVYINAENGTARTAWVKMYGGSIYNNSAVIRGGGLFNNGGYVLINGGWVNNNQALHNGGGLYNQHGSELWVKSGGFKGNKAHSFAGGNSIFSSAQSFHVYGQELKGHIDTDIPA